MLDAKQGKYSTGLKVQEIAAGDGEPVGPNSFVSLHYVLRRANGYFVDASYGFDRFDTFDFKMGKDQVPWPRVLRPETRTDGPHNRRLESQGPAAVTRR